MTLLRWKMSGMLLDFWIFSSRNHQMPIKRGVGRIDADCWGVGMTKSLLPSWTEWSVIWGGSCRMASLWPIFCERGFVYVIFHFIPSGLQAMSTTAAPMSTSHVFVPWVEFQRLILSWPPNLEMMISRSLSGQQDDGSRRLGEVNCSTASDAKAFVCIWYNQDVTCPSHNQNLIQLASPPSCCPSRYQILLLFSDHLSFAYFSGHCAYSHVFQVFLSSMVDWFVWQAGSLRLLRACLHSPFPLP